GDRAGGFLRPGRTHLDAARFEVRDEPPPRVVVADPRHQTYRLTERPHPGAEVGGLASAAKGDGRRRVVVRLEWAVGNDRDVEHEVADGDDQDHDGTSIAVPGIHAIAAGCGRRRRR